MAEKRVNVWIQEFKDRPNLMLQWIDPITGRRRSKSTGTNDPDKAEKVRADHEYELNNGLYQEPSQMTWEAFRKLYEREKLSGLRTNTQKKAGSVFNTFEKIVHPRTIGQISARTFSEYSTRLRERGSCPATIQGHLAYLRAALCWAADQKLLPSAPKVLMPKVPQKLLIRTIDEAQFQTLVKGAPNQHWQAYLYTAWHTGMRRTEMLDLTWDDISAPHIGLQTRRIWIPAAYNKAGRDEWLPIHPRLVEILAALPDKKGRVFPFWQLPAEVSRKFARIARKAGLQISLHDLRRSFGSRYAAKVSAPVLQRLMRHSDIKTTLRYYVAVDGVLEEAIQQA